MLSTELKTAASVWPMISNIVSVPRTEEEYERTVALLDELIDEVGENEKHPLAIVDGHPRHLDRSLRRPSFS